MKFGRGSVPTWFELTAIHSQEVEGYGKVWKSHVFFLIPSTLTTRIQTTNIYTCHIFCSIPDSFNVV